MFNAKRVLEPRDYMHEARLIADGDEEIVPRREHVRAVLDALDYQRGEWIALLHKTSEKLYEMEKGIREIQLEEA